MSETATPATDETNDDLDWASVLETDDTETTTEATAEPTEPTAEVPAPADDAEPVAEVVRDDNRDEKGRFKPKAEAAPVITDPVITPPAAEAVQPVPFALKVSGREIPIEGATYTKGVGLSIPEANLPTVQRTLQNGLYYEQHWKQIEQTAMQKGYEKALAVRSEKEEQANLMIQELQEICTNEESLLAFARQLATEGPLLMERARAKALEQQIADLKAASQPAPEDVEQQKVIQIATLMDEELEKVFASNPAIAQLFADAQERETLEERLFELYQAFVTPKGFDVVKYRKTIEYEASLRQRAREQAEEARKATAAAQKAAQFNAANKKPVPPAGTGARSAPARTTTTTATPQAASFRDFSRDFMKGNPFDEE